jgi:cell division protein FtsL
MLSIFGSMIVGVAALIVFVFTTFATRADVDDKVNDLSGHILEVRQDIKDVRLEVNQKLDVLIVQHKR